MTTTALRDAHDQTMSQLGAIAERLERGEISPSQADEEGSRIVMKAQQQATADAENLVKIHAAARRRRLAIYLAAGLLLLGIALVYRYL